MGFIKQQLPLILAAGAYLCVGFWAVSNSMQRHGYSGLWPLAVIFWPFWNHDV